MDPSGLGQQLCFCLAYGYLFWSRGSDFLARRGVFIAFEIVHHWRVWYDLVITLQNEYTLHFLGER